jgi:hypothetical protein
MFFFNKVPVIPIGLHAGWSMHIMSFSISIYVDGTRRKAKCVTSRTNVPYFHMTSSGTSNVVATIWQKLVVDSVGIPVAGAEEVQ